jgi:hypothetical protein
MSFTANSLDFYDDRGALLREVVPDLSEVPDFVKTASRVTQDDESNLFALVIQDGGHVLKKFATVDRGNTWLSTLYFFQNRDQLPEEAQKVAASHLLHACLCYDIDPPEELAKIAYSELPHDNLVNLTDMQVRRVAEVEKVAYALETEAGGRYPISDAQSAVTAMHYLDNHLRAFDPKQRREFAVKTAAALDFMGLPLAGAVDDYSGQHYSEHVIDFLGLRSSLLEEHGADDGWQDALAKIAADISQNDPEITAELLYKFDQASGLNNLWDEYIPDPYISVIGHQKIADETFSVGGRSTTRSALVTLSQDTEKVAEHFGPGVAEGFRSDPVAIFNSMPVPEQVTLIALAEAS